MSGLNSYMAICFNWCDTFNMWRRIWLWGGGFQWKRWGRWPSSRACLSCGFCKHKWSQFHSYGCGWNFRVLGCSHKHKRYAHTMQHRIRSRFNCLRPSDKKEKDKKEKERGSESARQPETKARRIRQIRGMTAAHSHSCVKKQYPEYKAEKVLL